MAQQSNSQLKASNLFTVDGITAVITGGGSGLGSYMARALALNGAKAVFIIGRREESLQKVASSVDTSNIHPIVGDVTSKQSLSDAVSTLKTKHNITAIDVLVCNSGVSGPSTPFLDSSANPLSLDQVCTNLWEADHDGITNMFAVNITGVHLTVAAFLPLLGAANAIRPDPPTEANFRPRPQIITTGSIGAYNRKPLGNITYGPSKAAVIHMTKMLATALVPHDIRANAIAPGLYLSEMTGGMFQSQGKTESHNVEGTWGKDVIPATRSGDEADMAGVVLWLCSRAGAYLNGSVVVTDGGRLGVLPSSF